MDRAYNALAAYYDHLGEHVDYKRYAEAAKELCTKYGEGTSGLVLDLACGTCSIGLELDRMGMEVIAVDASSEMLLQAREKASEAGADILFLCQDMRELDLYGTIDMAVCGVDSLNYLTSTKDLERCFSLVYNFLEPGGVFFFDMNTKEKFKTVYGDNSYVFEDDGVFCVWQNDYNERRGTCDFYVTIFTEEKDGRYCRRDEHHREKCYSKKTVISLLEKCGFEVLGAYRDLDFAPSEKDDLRTFFAAKAIKR